MSNTRESMPGDTKEEPKDFNAIYSREAYENILKLLTFYKERVKTLKRDQALYEEDLQEDERIYKNTHSESRAHKIESHNRMLKGATLNLKHAEGEVSRFSTKLQELYELAHEEALKQNMEYKSKQIDNDYNELLSVERRLEHFDPDNILTSEEQENLQTQFDKKLSSFLASIDEFFRNTNSG